MIKFRAWDNLLNKMLVVYRISFDGPVDGVQVHCYLDDRGAEGSTEYAYDGDGLILEQFTGLKDVNGNEIYENDIIVSEPTEPILGSPKIGVVKLSKVSFSWCFVTGNIEYNIWKTDKYRTYEVIGNVHANPELLEE